MPFSPEFVPSDSNPYIRGQTIITMNIIRRVISLLVLYTFHTITFSQCIPSGTSLATPYNTNNGQRGVMFDITATNNIYIECFDANLYAGTTADYEVYYKVGSFIGSESTPADWTLIGTTSALTSAGNNLPTPIPIPINVTILSGQTYGFYVTNTFGGGVAYTDGSSTTQTLASNTDLVVSGGTGKLYPFGFSYVDRYFNGTVHYTTIIPLSETANSFRATAMPDRTIKINWEIQNETLGHRYILERSEDGYNWKSIHEVVASTTNGASKSYQWIDQKGLSGESYYRINEMDLSGNLIYQDVVPVNQLSAVRQAPTTFPNPTNGITHIHASSDDLSDFRISDVLGREFTSDVSLAFRSNSLVELNLQRLPAGTYIVRYGSQSVLIMKE